MNFSDNWNGSAAVMRRVLAMEPSINTPPLLPHRLRCVQRRERESMSLHLKLFETSPRTRRPVEPGDERRIREKAQSRCNSPDQDRRSIWTHSLGSRSTLQHVDWKAAILDDHDGLHVEWLPLRRGNSSGFLDTIQGVPPNAATFEPASSTASASSRTRF